MPGRAPGQSSAARFFDAESGDKLENPIVPTLADSERQYTGHIVPAHEDTPLGAAGARLKVFKRWSADPRMKDGGNWKSVTELYEADHHLVPWATLHTTRTLAGTPIRKKTAMQEEISAAEIEEMKRVENYVSKHGSCAVCGLRPGDLWPFGEKNEPVPARCFFIDHVLDWEPTWTREGADMEDDLENGKAQVLCFFHNDMKTNGKHGQGDSVPHASREATKRNLQENGHLLAASSTDEKLEESLQKSRGKMSKKHKA